MYKLKKKSSNPTQLFYWFKRKFLVIFTAFMLGFSNSIIEKDKSIFDYHYSIEQRDKEER